MKLLIILLVDLKKKCCTSTPVPTYTAWCQSTLIQTLVEEKAAKKQYEVKTLTFQGM